MHWKFSLRKYPLLVLQIEQFYSESQIEQPSNEQVAHNCVVKLMK
jgi:hypothetical protein